MQSFKVNFLIVFCIILFLACRLSTVRTLSLRALHFSSSTGASHESHVDTHPSPFFALSCCGKVGHMVYDRREIGRSIKLHTLYTRLISSKDAINT